MRVIFYHTLLFFYNFTIPFTFFFFSPSVSVFINRVLKKRKKSMFFIGKGLSDYLFVECNSSSIHFVCPLSSNQRGCWYLSTSLKWEFKPHLHATPTSSTGYDFIQPCWICAKFEDNRIAIYCLIEVSHRVKQVMWNVFVGRENSNDEATTCRRTSLSS